MTEFKLDDYTQAMENRLEELEPMVAEYHKIGAILKVANGNGFVPQPASPARPRQAATPRRGRPPGTGTRKAEALDLVRKNPGITIPQMAETMGIKQNYLYRVMPALADEGAVVKDGQGWKVA